mmetsp:Transcript_16285/g.14213  ORF Transcript_16285/g.14213 Transcript_16285/m.14213 type:complete len:84 (-) Transcript_16285:152-403(-)
MLKNPPQLLSIDQVPDKVLKRFPPTRFTIAGHDPLRDDSFKLALKLRKQGVNVQLTCFKALMHAFMSHEKKPYPLPEAQKALD